MNNAGTFLGKIGAFLERLRKPVETFSYILAIIASPFAVVEYLEHKDQNRDAASLAYVVLFQDEQYFSARIELSKPWLDLDLESLREKNPSKKVLGALGMEKFDEYEDRQKLENSIILITDFFDGIQSCIRVELCSENVVLESLGSDSESIYNLYSSVLIHLRAKYADPNFGRGLEKIALRSGERN